MMRSSDIPSGTRIETQELTAAELEEFADLSPPGEQDKWLSERVSHEVITWTALEIGGGPDEPVKGRVRYVRSVAVSCEVNDDPRDVEDSDA